MRHRHPTVKGALSFSNPTVRAWLFQIIAVVTLVAIAIYLIHNTITNLNNRKSNLNTLFLKSSHSLLEFILNLL